MFLEQKKRRIWLYGLAVIAALFVGAAIFVFLFLRNLPVAVFSHPGLIKKSMELMTGTSTPQETSDLLGALPALLGIASPKTYLFLFENNTELRPGGGFLGSYAVVTLNNAKFQIEKLDGSDLLDRTVSPDIMPPAPRPMVDYLRVSRWYFRDSNWSPDFAESAKQALEFYRREGGISADQIDAVFAVTPTVLEELLRVTGPVTVNGVEFTADNVTERLDYEVEIAYKEQGKTLRERKKILTPFMETLVDRLKGEGLSHYLGYFALGKRLGEEKQVMAYSSNAELEDLFTRLGIDGRMKETAGDYVLWADSNMGGLKSDYAMRRKLSYVIATTTVGYRATLTMTYTHTATTTDWRTRHYRTYARVYVPRGSKLVKIIGSMKNNYSTLPGPMDSGEELGKQWFGTFTVIELGETKPLTFVYDLPKNVSDQIGQGLYTLLVQKELGTTAHSLTLDLKFGTTVAGATPPEAREKWGDGVYEVESSLWRDQSFEVQL